MPILEGAVTVRIGSITTAANATMWLVSRFDDDDDSVDPNESGGLWEYQLHPLNAARLRQALAGLDDDLPVEVGHYDGTGALQKLRPMHIDLRGFNGEAQAVVIVVH